MTPLVEKAQKWNPTRTHYRYAGEDYLHYACYSSVYHNTGEELTIYHPFPHLVDLPYMDWVINSDFFGKNFITKDAEEGVHYGFKARLNGETTADRVIGFVALRFPLEFKLGDSWSKFRAIGLTEMESLWLMHWFNASSGKLVPWSGNSNHYCLPKYMSPKCLTHDNFPETSNWMTGSWPPEDMLNVRWLNPVKTKFNQEKLSGKTIRAIKTILKEVRKECV